MGNNSNISAIISRKSKAQIEAKAKATMSAAINNFKTGIENHRNPEMPAFGVSATSPSFAWYGQVFRGTSEITFDHGAAMRGRISGGGEVDLIILYNNGWEASRQVWGDYNGEFIGSRVSYSGGHFVQAAAIAAVSADPGHVDVDIDSCYE